MRRATGQRVDDQELSHAFELLNCQAMLIFLVFDELGRLDQQLLTPPFDLLLKEVELGDINFVHDVVKDIGLGLGLIDKGVVRAENQIDFSLGFTLTWCCIPAR